MRKILYAFALLLFAVAPITNAFAGSQLTRDTDSTNGASVPTTGIKLSMYRGLRLNSCSLTDPNVAPGPTTFPANTPFFVRHGWVLSFVPGPADQSTIDGFHRPTTNFQLYVDHIEQQSLPDFFVNSDGTGQFKLFVTNFPNGMTGTHLFVGWWFIDGGSIGGTPNTPVFNFACALTVTFT